jgi:GlpG protein
LNRPVTLALVVACVAVGLATNLGEKVQPVVSALSIAPYWKEDGAFWWYPGLGLQNVRQGQVWRLITPALIHFGLLHLFFNMSMLLTLGGQVEHQRGSLRFLLLVLVIAIPSNLAEYFVHFQAFQLTFQRMPMFGGMSGVLYGLFGYVWMKSVYDPWSGLALGPNTVLFMMGWLFLCMTGAIGSVANVAHVVGLLVGMLIGYAAALFRAPPGS